MALPVLAAAMSGDGREILLVRHAHAEWPAWQGRDFDRPLTPQGEQDALRTARAISDAGHLPALIMTSGARRTRQTGEIIGRELALPEDRQIFVDALYDGSAATLAHALRDLARSTPGLLLLVAHNPGVSELARELGDLRTRPFAPGEWRLLPLQDA